MNVTHPFLLVNGDEPAPDFERADYEVGLTGNDVYEQGDLVYVTATGTVRKAQAVAASMPLVAVAGQSYSEDALDLPPNDGSSPHWFYGRGVPMNKLDQDSHEIVFTYKGATADGTAHTFATADRQSVLAHTQVELKWDTVELCYVLSATTTNPNVEMLYVEEGDVGDDNVRVACRLLPAFIRK